MKNLLIALVFSTVAALSSFAARTVESYNAGWEFSHDQKSWNKVMVPHDWAIEEGFDAKLPHSSGALPWKGVGYYRKTLTLEAKPAGRIFLEFDGIMCDGAVYVDGQCAGHQAYGYLGLNADITPYVHAGKNEILVKADTTKLHSRWYPGAGVYRNVRIVTTDSVFMPEDELFIYVEEVEKLKSGKVEKLKSGKVEELKEKATVKVEGVLRNISDVAADGEVTVEIRDFKGKAVAKTVVNAAAGAFADGAFAATLEIANPLLWKMEPYARLYTVAIDFRSPTATDSLEKRIGIRTCRLDADGGFFLNGERVQLKGVDLHADLGILGMAFNKSAMRRQLEIMRDMGANALRTSHNPPAPEVLDLCDEMGFFVWDECFDKWTATAGKGDEALEPYVEEHLVQMIKRDRNHASVFVWSMGNEIPSGGGFAPGQEIWGQKESEGTTRERCTRFRRAMKAVDPTRPVGMGCCFTKGIEHGDYADLDFTGWNYLEKYVPMKKKYPAKPVVYSESASAFSVYGYYYPQRQATNKTDYVGAPDMIDSYDRNSAMWSDIADVEFERMERDRFVAGEFVWTGIDYLGEPAPYEKTARSSYFGICDLVGFPKDRYYLYRSHWNKEAFTLHIVPHHWNFEGVEKLPVYVYSSAKEVELFLNGVSLGRRRKDSNATSKTGYYDVMKRYRFIWEDVAYEPGELKAVAYDDAGKELGKQSVRTAGPAAKVVVEPETTDLPDALDEYVFFKVRLVDANGVTVPYEDRYVNFIPEGQCAVVAVGNGNPCGLESFRDLRGHHLHNGRVGFAVRRLRQGAANVRVTAEGLISGEYTFAGGEDDEDE